MSEKTARGRLPVIVGLGGINSAGRVSFHHAYRRLVVDVLGEADRNRTYASLARLMNLEADSGERGHPGVDRCAYPGAAHRAVRSRHRAGSQERGADGRRRRRRQRHVQGRSQVSARPRPARMAGQRRRRQDLPGSRTRRRQRAVSRLAALPGLVRGPDAHRLRPGKPVPVAQPPAGAAAHGVRRLRCLAFHRARDRGAQTGRPTGRSSPSTPAAPWASSTTKATAG